MIEWKSSQQRSVIVSDGIRVSGTVSTARDEGLHRWHVSVNNSRCEGYWIPGEFSKGGLIEHALRAHGTLGSSTKWFPGPVTGDEKDLDVAKSKCEQAMHAVMDNMRKIKYGV